MAQSRPPASANVWLGGKRRWRLVRRNPPVSRSLPTDTETGPATQKDATIVLPRGDGETVLVVEDDGSVCMLVADVLEELGYRLVETIDSSQALPVIEGVGRIDLLVSDVGLPGMNGRQIAEIAIAARPDLKVLYITGYAAAAAARAEFHGPGMEMIVKPFAIDDLAQKI